PFLPPHTHTHTQKPLRGIPKRRQVAALQMPKPLTYNEALAKLRRIFPGHEVTVYDGDACQESGLVETVGGGTIASFKLSLQERGPNTIPAVSKIRVGAVGQFCGTADEINTWEQSQSDPVYLDYNATTPMDPRVLAVMTPWFLAPSNAGSRTHEYGRRAKEAVEQARAQVAAVTHAKPEEIIFTSGATESNNLALLGLRRFGEESNRRHILSTAIEHKAVLEPLEQLSQAGFEVELCPVTSGGYVEPDEIRRRLRPDTLLVSVMHANNETGVLQPVLEIGQLLADTPTLFHVDAAQTFGKEVDQFQSLDCDFLSISSHKIYGPQGIGALLVRRRPGQPRRLNPLLFGGGQERGLRPGTVPVALAVGLGEAARLAGAEWQARRAAALKIREQLLHDLQAVEHRLNGDPTRCQPHVLNVSFPGIDSEAFMMATRHTVSTSNGSACTSASYKPSHVLLAMGLGDESLESAVRLSWGAQTTRIPSESIVAAVRAIRS
ncbi:MAG: aminotransferase class V-fold PLP-dependent enzyme, partial [Planctomycetota bacterium]|nr:aminotransferase class V-fold PLP-dependent enzyme [Planctomycetota bacterium]